VGVEVQFHATLIATLGGGEWSVSRAGCFTQGEHPLVLLGSDQCQCGRSENNLMALATIEHWFFGRAELFQFPLSYITFLEGIGGGGGVYNRGQSRFMKAV
jgi:hypothetical protein